MAQKYNAKHKKGIQEGCPKFGGTRIIILFYILSVAVLVFLSTTAWAFIIAGLDPFLVDKMNLPFLLDIGHEVYPCY